MADPQPLRSTARDVSMIDYKPISGVAVAAIVVAGIYVVILLATTIFAFAKGRAALDIQLLLLAGLGLILAVVARIHIQRSEGTRTGAKMVAVAWWLSVVGGAAFGAYYVASSLSLKKQSESVALEWFDLLKTQRIDEAFIMTIDPKSRQNIKADDLSELDARFGAGALPMFRNCDLVRMMQRNGEDVAVTPLGVGSWQQIPEGYRLESRYQLACPEGIFNFNLNMIGAEGENIDGRQWYIPITDGNLSNPKRTSYGRMMLELKGDADQFAATWLDALRRGSPEEVILGALEAERRPSQILLLCAQRVTENIIGHPLPAFLAASLIGPGSTGDGSMMERVYASLNSRGFFQADPGKFLTEEQKNRFKEAWKIGKFQRAGGQRLQNPETSPQINVTPEEIRYTFPIEFALPGTPNSSAGGRIVVVSTAPDFVKEMQDLKALGKAHPDRAETSPNLLLKEGSDRQWRILRIETSLESLAAPRTATAPGGPGGPTTPGGR